MEAIQKMSDSPLLTCPECGEESLKKQLTAAAFQLKGTGWYATDFKNSGKPAAAKDVKTDSSVETAKSTTAGATSSSDSNSAASKPSAAASE
jgi:putative FmdB family regulatory protein